MQTELSLDEVNELCDQGMDLADHLDASECVELLETGSVTIQLGDREIVIALKFTEEQQHEAH